MCVLFFLVAGAGGAFLAYKNKKFVKEKCCGEEKNVFEKIADAVKNT